MADQAQRKLDAQPVAAVAVVGDAHGFPCPLSMTGAGLCGPGTRFFDHKPGDAGSRPEKRVFR
jgi:hypothetical protein